VNAEPTSEASLEPPSGLPARLAARIEAIVRAAEQEALAVQRDLAAQRRLAEQEARRYLDEAHRRADAIGEDRVRRLRELTDELVQRAELVKRQLDELARAIERAAGAVERDPELRPTPEARPPAVGAPPAGEPISFARSAPAAAPADGDRARGGDVGAARLVAIEMAVAGRSRQEAARHLRDSFRLADTERLLDDVFGPAADTPFQPPH
jgi:hypothetical protein